MIVATINRPGKWVATWGYTAYTGGDKEEYVNGFATRAAALEALRSKHPTAEIISNKEYNQRVGYARWMFQRANGVDANFATNG